MLQKHQRDVRFLLLLALLVPSVAHAYLDPGFGMLVVQAVLASLVGAAIFLRSTIAASFRWARLKISGAPPAPPKSPSERPTEQG